MLLTNQTFVTFTKSQKNSVYSGKNLFKKVELSLALIERYYFRGPNTQLSSQRGLKLEIQYSSVNCC